MLDAIILITAFWLRLFQLYYQLTKKQSELSSTFLMTAELPLVMSYSAVSSASASMGGTGATAAIASSLSNR